MTIEFWGLEGGISFGFPTRISGIVFIVIESLFLLGLLIYYLRQTTWRTNLKRRWDWLLLLGLMGLAPIATQVILIHPRMVDTVIAPGVTSQPSEPVFSVFGALPWMLAAGLLGEWPAVLVALAGGIFRGGLETHRVLTTYHSVVQALLTAWLLRRNYSGRIGRLARNPIGAGLIGGLSLAPFFTLEFYFYSGGTLYDGLDFALSLARPTLLTLVAETFIAGAICELIRTSGSDLWYQPQEMVVGPYNRSLTARILSLFVVLGVVASSVLITGGWLLAQASAQDLVEKQMRHTAKQAGDIIPYFIQLGRSYSRRTAIEIGTSIEVGITSETLADQLQHDTFFNQLAVFNVNQQLLTSYPSRRISSYLMPDTLTVSLSTVLRGIPEELILLPERSWQSAQIAFLWPIEPPGQDLATGVLVGWTDLRSNPVMESAVNNLADVVPGEAFVTDGEATVLLGFTSGREIELPAYDSTVEDEIVIGTSSDGTRHLVYTYGIDGYPWNVIITTPIREVQRQALQIATRLSLVIAVVGVLLIGLVYAISRRLTAPLRLMADVAQSITEGDLAQPISVTGEDEIGQLASSFEEMRKSLKARLDEMDLLLTVSQNVASSFELSEILPTILSGVAHITNADVSRLVLLPTLGVPGTFQFGEDPGNWAAIDPQILSMAAERGRFMLENPARARAVIDFQDITRPIEALIALPIQHEDDFVGALWLGHVTSRTFTPDQINLLSILATQLGIAVANANLYQQVEQERSRLMAVLEWSPDAFLLIDREGRLSLVNPAAAGLLVGEIEDALGMPAAEHIANPKLVDFLLASDQELRTMEIELDPGRVMFASVSDILPEGGEVSGRLWVLRDITHYKKLDTLKSEFVSTVSHDLRAPLTLLRGYATMLSMVGSMSDQQKEFMDKIHSSVDQMDNLVDNLLDLGRIEAGLGLELGRIKIEELIDEVINAYRPQAVNKRISLEVDMAHDMQEVEVDTPLIRQAVGNLLDNALRYTPAEGKVTVRVYQHNTRQVISISDTGVGIAPADQARLFEKFYRAPRLDDDREGGLGLGLAIVKSIVDQHGGSVAVESRLGSGSTFTIEIPVRSRLHVDQDSNS